MQAEEPMTVNERRKYLKLMRPRYQAADRKGQGVLYRFAFLEHTPRVASLPKALLSSDRTATG
jgi:hypothetical protein